MANSLSSYEPTPAHRALAAEGLTLRDQETLAAFATRVGWKMDAEDWPTFLHRKRGTSSRADAGTFRQDARQGADVPAPPGGRNLSGGHEAGHSEVQEMDAAKARKDMVQRLKTGWKMSKADREKARLKAMQEDPASKDEEQARTAEAEEGEDDEPMDDEPMDAAHERQRMLDRRFGKK